MNSEIKELPNDQVEKIISGVSSNLINHFESKDKENKNRIMYNTKLLLRNYKKLKAHCVLVEVQLEEDAETFWNHKWLDLDNLMQNKAKTVKIMKQVDKAIEYYKKDCFDDGSDNSIRRYDILKMKYLNDVTLSDDDIAAEYDIARTTVVRQVDKAISDISVLLFGIDIFIAS